MPNYEKYKCPVCNQQFSRDDDIVTCPECGTPHHRECYNLTGHCVNRGLHSTGYSFLEEHKPIIPEKPQPAISGEYYTPQGDSAKADSNNTENDEEQSPIPSFQPIQFNTPQYNEEGEIDGVSINDIAATVRTNPKRFVDVFKKQSQGRKKLGWNWGAFFFGAYYYLFRKMYKQGFAFFCIQFSIIMLGDTALFKLAPKYMAEVQRIVTSFDPTAGTAPDVSSLIGISDAQTAATIVYAMLGALLLFRIIITVFADYFYKGTVFDIIKKVSEQIQDGASFISSPFFTQETGLNQDQMRRMYLGNRGGVSLFAPMLAYFIFYIVTSFI